MDLSITGLMQLVLGRLYADEVIKMEPSSESHVLFPGHSSDIESQRAPLAMCCRQRYEWSHSDSRVHIRGRAWILLDLRYRGVIASSLVRDAEGDERTWS